MKRAVYILAFALLGALLQAAMHALLEMAVLPHVVDSGLPWNRWLAIHRTASLALLIAGTTLGFRAGVRWWNILYVEKRYGWPPRRRKA